MISDTSPIKAWGERANIDSSVGTRFHSHDNLTAHVEDTYLITSVNAVKTHRLLCGIRVNRQLFFCFFICGKRRRLDKNIVKPMEVFGIKLLPVLKDYSVILMVPTHIIQVMATKIQK